MIRQRHDPRGSIGHAPGPSIQRATLALLLLIAVTAPPARAGSFTPGNLLLETRATTGDFVARLVEVTPSGSIVQTVDVPPVGDTEPRDLVVDELGRAHVFNGTFVPYLSSYNPATGSWQNHTFAGWSIINNVTYGGIAVAGSFVFVTDQATFGTGQMPSGIVRFDTNDFSAVRFADGSDYIDLTLGWDGLLYALYPSGSPGGTAADVWNPATLSLVRTVSLPSTQGLRALAVDGAGTIFAVGLNTGVYKYSSSGAQLAFIDTQILLGTSDYLDDIDLGPGGKLAISTDCGGIAIGDVTLDPQTTRFIQYPWCFPMWATFVPGGATPVRRMTWGHLKSLYR